MCFHFQVLLRQQLIQEKLNRWSDYNNDVKALQESMTDLETTITNNRDHHIEDLIFKLQNDWKDRLELTKRKKDNLVSRGQELANASGEVRASDISQKNKALEEQYERLAETAADRYENIHFGYT